MTDALLQSLLSGDVFGFVISCYTSLIGQGFYGFVLAITFGVIYNRTKSVALCSILWLLLGGAWITTVRLVSPIAIVLVAAGVAGIVYSVFGRGD